MFIGYIYELCAINPMTYRDLNKDLDRLVSEVCAPVLKALEFKKSGVNFFRYTEEIVQTFNIQKSSFSSSSELSFTGNIGFIEPETYLKLYQVDSLPKTPKCTDAIIQFRFGHLTDTTDYWYRIKQSCDLSDVYPKLAQDISTLRDFFENHRTIRSLEEFTRDKAKINPFWGEVGQFALLKKLGKDKEARSILESAYQKAQVPQSLVTVNEKINGIWIEKMSEPEINHHWKERIEKAACLYNEKLV